MNCVIRGLLPGALVEANALREIAQEHASALGERRQALSDSIHQRLDRLLQTLLDGCHDKSQPTVSQVKPVLEQHVEFTEDSFHEIDCRLIALVIVRELVSRHKLVVHQRELPVWPEFVKRFNAVCRA